MTSPSSYCLNLNHEEHIRDLTYKGAQLVRPDYLSRYVYLSSYIQKCCEKPPARSREDRRSMAFPSLMVIVSCVRAAHKAALFLLIMGIPGASK